MMYDNTIFKNASKGIAITNKGVYCNTGNMLKKFTWEQYATLNISYSKGFLYFGRFPFNSSKVEIMQVFEIVSNLQQEIKKHLKG